MGCLYNVLPGYAPVTDEAARRRFEAAWGISVNVAGADASVTGVDETVLAAASPVKDAASPVKCAASPVMGAGAPVTALPDQPGLTATEMMGAAHSGLIEALLIMGENPVLSDADSHHVVESLKRLKFLAVIDIFLTETAQLAEVVLPAASFAEKSGSFTNTERRVQLVRQAIRPVGDSRPDWQILQEIGRRLGLTMDYASPAEIMEEVATVVPSYGGISHDRLGDQGLQWPCPARDHPGTKFLHKDKFPRGRGRLSVVHYRPSAESTDEYYPLILTTGRILYQYHTGSMTRRSGGLKSHHNEPYVEIHPSAATRLGIQDGDLVRIITRRGQVEAKARVANRTGPKVLFMPFHYAEAAANILTNPALDPLSKIPEFKACAARVEKVEHPAT
jgi:predicted molibdopterin-dependent oxidoreductase YjgC